MFPSYSNMLSKLTGKTSLLTLKTYRTPDAILGAPKEEVVSLIALTSRKGLKYATSKCFNLKVIVVESTATIFLGIDKDLRVFLFDFSKIVTNTLLKNSKGTSFAFLEKVVKNFSTHQQMRRPSD